MALGMAWKILGVVSVVTWELQDKGRELRSRLKLGQLQAGVVDCAGTTCGWVLETLPCWVSLWHSPSSPSFGGWISGIKQPGNSSTQVLDPASAY